MTRSLGIGIFVMVGLLFLGVSSAFALEFSGSASFTGVVGVAIPISDLSVTGTSTDPIPVKLLVTNGTLAITETTGLTFTGGTSGSTLYFSGSIANVNNGLASLTYTRGGTGSDTLEASLVAPGEVFFEETGHLYEYISYTSSWDDAKTHAEGLTRYGAQGYLATIMSAEENEFVRLRLENAGWMGASDAESEGTWKWVTGPEAGTAFWQGTYTGGPVDDNYANWADSEPNDHNNGNPGEDCGQFLAGASGEWNDLPCASQFSYTLPGYVAEFGAPGDMPNVGATSVSITTTALPVVSSFFPLDNATSVSRELELVITFSKVVDPESGNISVYKSSDDSLVESIPVGSSKVSGGGTNTITVALSTKLEKETAYYVQITSTAFDDIYGGSYVGISNTTTWNFITNALGGGNYIAPPTCSVTFSPAKIYQGDSARISVNAQFPGEKGSYYVLDQRSHKTYSAGENFTVSPTKTTQYSFAIIGTYGANFCDGELVVEDKPVEIVEEPEVAEEVSNEAAQENQQASEATASEEEGENEEVVMMDEHKFVAPVCFENVWKGGLVKRGVRGTHARCVQEMVNSLPLERDILVDGMIGSESDWGIRKAQQYLGVPVDGVWGNVTHGVYVGWVDEQ